MRSRWLILLAIVIAVWWFWGRTLAPVRVIRAQLQAVDAGDMALAYSYLSKNAKATMTLEQLEDRVLANSVVQQPTDSTFLSRKMEGDRATISGTLESQDGQLCDLTYTLVKESGEWRIASFQWSLPRLATD
jgi:hypothetical protein